MNMPDRPILVNPAAALLELEERDSPGQCPNCGSTMMVNEVCIECVEDGQLIHEPGGWRPAPRETWWGLIKTLAMLPFEVIREDWRAHQQAAAAKKARKAERRL